MKGNNVSVLKCRAHRWSNMAFSLHTWPGVVRKGMGNGTLAKLNIDINDGITLSIESCSISTSFHLIY